MAASRWYTPDAVAPVRALPRTLPLLAPLSLLRRQPWRFELAMAVRLLEQNSPGSVPVGLGAFPGREAVRFRQELDFSAPPAPLVALIEQGDAVGRCHLTISDGVFIGSGGVLPYAYAAWVRDLARLGDEGPRAFLDVLQHRLTSVQVRAERSLRPGLQGLDPARTAMTTWALSCLGLGAPTVRDRLSIPDTLMLRQAPLFLGRARSAVGLERSISDYLTRSPQHPVAVRLVPFQGGWHPLPRAFQTVLGDVWGQGGQNLRLGGATQPAVLGRRVHDPAAGIQLVIGPLPLERFVTLLPYGPDYRRLTDLVRFYLPDPLTVSVRLVLAAGQRPPLRLGSPLARLGWSSWLTAGRPRHQPQDGQVHITLPQVWQREDAA